ncbi:DMT family transporter [Salidesulfovibrio brasiliensis]|uniref:DMT family transporter n=1 Tax=Salidesulfovibrio brasiliensis TaxID=221711 RepID=UPI0006D149DB|nr:DMT family transporter [Salidesulfovibrio brasiliensis]
MNREGNLFIYLLLVGTMALWGGTWITGKMLAGSMGPLSASFLRFISASVFLVAMAWRQEDRFPGISLRHVPHVCFLGLTGVFMYSWFFFKGLQTVPASRAALIVACIPVCVASVSALIFRERFGPIRIVGTLLSLAGVAMVLSDGDPISLFESGVETGDLLILGCVAAWTGYSIGGRVAMQHLQPARAVMWSCVFGSLFLLVPALQQGLVADVTHSTLTDWANILYLGVAATGVSYAWYYRGIQAIGPARAAIFINLVPVFAILFATILLGESVALSLLGGGAMVIVGVTLTNRFK